MRRAARVDGNHGAIMKAFRKLGFAVADTSKLGAGFPDLAISRNSHTVLAEVKDGAKVKSARKLTEPEKEFRAGWKGVYLIVESLADVERIERNWFDISRGLCK